MFQKYIGSIVIVEFRKKSYTELKKLWDRVAPIGGRGADRKNAAELKEAREAREASLQCGALCCTGSVVKIEESHISILTCAHVLEASFSQSNPITPAGVEDYFNVFIVCDHREGRCVSGLEARQYIQAGVRRISCGMDLMLLSIPRNAFQAYCAETHAAIPMARAYPEALEKVVMLSWPPLRHRTAVSGETSHQSRLNSHVSTNPQGFTFRLAEVNILSERGSSGAPLINGASELLCTLHGGYGTFSYFVSFEDVRSTLVLWDVLEADEGV